MNKHRIAWHEAGHAVVGRHLGMPMTMVSIWQTKHTRPDGSTFKMWTGEARGNYNSLSTHDQRVVSVAGAMADPQLTVLDSNQNVVGFNDRWGGTAALQAAFNAVSAFPLPTTSADSAVLVTLSPGTYTAQVNSAGGSSGIALLEMYQMP